MDASLRTQSKTKAFESIGWLDAEALLKFMFPNGDGYNICNGKSIIDMGAGFWLLLKLIGQNSTPECLTAVDPIYDWGELHAAKYTRNSVQNFIRAIIEDPNWKNDPTCRDFHSDAERQLNETNEFKREPNINYISNLSPLPENFGDIVFVSSLLYWVDGPKKLLGEIDSVLSPGGVIMIVDFTTRGTIYQKIKNAGLPIAGTYNRYFHAILRKDDYLKIANDTVFSSN